MTNQFSIILESISRYLTELPDFPSWKADQINQLVDEVELHLLTDTSKSVQIDFFANDGYYFQSTEVKPYSQVVECLPLYDMEYDCWRFAKPHVIIAVPCRIQSYIETILFHEITHLFALSSHGVVDDELIFKSGANTYWIHKNGRITEKTDKSRNECLTDLAASILHKRLGSTKAVYFCKNPPNELYQIWPELQSMQTDKEENEFLQKYFTNGFC